MGQMLDALRQIQSKRTPASPAVRPVSAEELENLGLARPAAPWRQAEEPAEGDGFLSEAVQAWALPEPCLDPAMSSLSVTEIPIYDGPAEEASDRPADAGRVSTAVEAQPNPPPEHEPALGRLCSAILARLSERRPAVLAFGDVEADGLRSVPARWDGSAAAVVARVAAALADRGRGEVLALDADLHRPRLAEKFGEPPFPGLIDVLTGSAAWQDVVRPGGTPRLSLLPGGGACDASSVPVQRLLRPLGILLAELRERFSLVLIAAGAIRPAPSASWAASTEGLYLIVPLGPTRRRALRHAVRAVKSAGIPLLGGIVVEPGRRPGRPARASADAHGGPWG